MYFFVMVFRFCLLQPYDLWFFYFFLPKHVLLLHLLFILQIIQLCMFKTYEQLTHSNIYLWCFSCSKSLFKSFIYQSIMWTCYWRTFFELWLFYAGSIDRRDSWNWAYSGSLFEFKYLRISFKTVITVVTSSIWHAHLGYLSSSRLGSLISSGCLGHVKPEHFDCVSC